MVRSRSVFGEMASTEEYPYAKMTFSADFYVCGHCKRVDVDRAECGGCEFCVNCCTHRKTSDEDDMRDKVTIDQVYESLEAAIDAACDLDIRNAISAEYRKQIRQRYESDKTSERAPRPNIAEPIKDGEGSHLFTVLEIYEMKTWANGYLKAVDTYVEIKNYAEDDWVEYKLPSGEIADVQFSRNDDEQSPSYKMIEAFAYRTKADGEGNRTTDTDDCVRLF